ncbi:MAG: thiol:disulfide interchange protein DsbA/DsbL [Nevskiales bacterium]|nr:thiol:disulfide interchange protein DsbA/DsbL [Nevskiales bacterium]
MRLFVRGLLAAALSLTALACSAGDTASAYTEGKHYKEVRNVQAPTDPKRIEVDEFFWYGCPHCFAFDPTIEAWAKTKPADVDFVRVPNSLGRPQGVIHAKAYYTAEALGVLDQMHHPLFNTIQNDHIPLSDEAQLATVFNKYTGVLPDVFSSTFNGFSVDAKTRKAEQMARDFGITSVPTVVVGGKYVTSGSMAGSFQEATKVIDFLIEKVRKERAAN